MATRKSNQLPPPVEPDLPSLDGYPEMTGDYMNGVPQEVIDDTLAQPEVQRAEPVRPATGAFMDLGFIQAINDAPSDEEAKAMYDSLDPALKHVYDRSYGMQISPKWAADTAQEFYKMQDERAKMASSPQAQVAQKQSAQRRAASLDTISSMRSTINDVLEHPGFSGSVGAKNASYLFGLKSEPIAGTKEADFKALLDQVQGGAFLQAFESLKGGGQITQIEGEKATQAIVRAQQSQSEEGFKKSMNDFLSVLDKAEKRTLGGESASASPAATTAQATVTAMPRATKTIGGATWEKGDDGKWYKKR